MADISGGGWTGTVTISLKDAGLAHAPGQSDKCEGQVHDVDMLSVTALRSPDFVEAGLFPEVFQALHDAAHPGGTASWEKCLETECTDAWYLLYGEEA